MPDWRYADGVRCAGAREQRAVPSGDGLAGGGGKEPVAAGRFILAAPLNKLAVSRICRRIVCFFLVLGVIEGVNLDRWRSSRLELADRVRAYSRWLTR